MSWVPFLKQKPHCASEFLVEVLYMGQGFKKCCAKLLHLNISGVKNSCGRGHAPQSDKTAVEVKTFGTKILKSLAQRKNS